MNLTKAPPSDVDHQGDIDGNYYRINTHKQTYTRTVAKNTTTARGCSHVHARMPNHATTTALQVKNHALQTTYAIAATIFAIIQRHSIRPLRLDIL